MTSTGLFAELSQKEETLVSGGGIFGFKTKIKKTLHKIENKIENNHLIIGDQYAHPGSTIIGDTGSININQGTPT